MRSPDFVRGFDAVTVSQISAKGYHTLALVADGSVWAWGANGHGQVGDGEAEAEALTPVHPISFEDFVAVAANNISVGVKYDGTVWIWGPNDIDDPTAGGSSEPVQLQGIDGIQSVSAGRQHVLALRNDGTVWAWGDNSDGQLGDGSGHDQYRPVRVRHLDDVKAVAAGNDFSLALRDDGTVWGWGSNGDAQFGMETLSDDGTAHYTERRFPIHIESFRNPVAAIAAGSNYTAVIEEGTGQLLLCGLNLAGCIGAGDPSVAFYAEPTAPTAVGSFTGDGIVSVAVSFYNTYAVDRAGTVWAWGNNTFDQWGPGTHGMPEDGLAHRVKNVPAAVSVSAGAGHAMVATRDGQVWTWGSNAGGQLGHGAYAIPNPPGWCGLDGVEAFAAGVYHSLAIAHRPE